MKIIRLPRSKLKANFLNETYKVVRPCALGPQLAGLTRAALQPLGLQSPPWSLDTARTSRAADSARSTARTDCSASALPSARGSACAAADPADAPVTARPSARASARPATSGPPSAAESGRATGRESDRLLLSVRSDMSTARLEVGGTGVGLRERSGRQSERCAAQGEARVVCRRPLTPARVHPRPVVPRPFRSRPAMRLGDNARAGGGEGGAAATAGVGGRGARQRHPDAPQAQSSPLM